MTITVTKTPRQQRSMKTHNALLDAAERLLKKRPWEEISTVAIMLEAGVSNGAIYGRFKSKDELLVALYDRHDAQLKKRVRKRDAEIADSDLSFEEALDDEIDNLVKTFRENRWLLKAMGMLSRKNPEVVSQRTRRERGELLDKIAKRYEQFEKDFDHPQPKRALELSIFFVATILREAILYQGPHFGTLDISDRELKQSVKRMALGFVGYRK